MEIWKDVSEYDGYQVSNLGRVKSLNYNKTGVEKILKPIMSNRYLSVHLWKDGKAKMRRVHRIVAEAFLDNPDNLPQINHKNEIKTDNRVENLEWCDGLYNHRYGTINERISKSLTNNPKKCKTIYQYSIDGEFIAEYPSAKEVQRQLGFSDTYIGYCCKGKFKQAYGYKWSYNLY